MADTHSGPDTANDGDSQEKKRARRRLVGATALALLAAIVLPMVMDHEPRPPAQDIQVRIPSQDATTPTSRILTGKPVPTPLAPAPVLPTQAKIETPIADSTVELAKPAASRLENKASTPQIDNEPKPEAKPLSEIKPAVVTKPESKAEVKAEPKHVEADKAKPDSKEAARAEKILGGGSVSSSSQWILQLGAYQDTGNIKVLQAKVKELGYSSYTEKVDTPQGARTRVRAGPFASRDAAEKAQARLKKIGAGGPPGGVLSQK